MVATLVLTPNSGTVGTSSTITGAGYVINHVVTFTFAGAALTTSPATVTTDGSGNIPAGVTFTVPQAVFGANTVAASDGTNSPTATFTVSASVSLAPNNGTVGSTVTATFQGYAATSVITCTFGATGVTLSATTTGANGSLTATFTVPSGVADSVFGAHTVTGTDAGSHTANTTYTINAQIVLTPNHGDRNVTISVTATGYAATSALTGTMGGVAITLSSSTTSAFGSVTATFTIPSSVADGSITVSITDAATHNATAIYLLEIAGIVFNTTFSRLNGRNLFIKSTIPSREREAIVDITFSSTDEYTTGGVTVDFSTIQQFKTVYLCEIVHKSYGLAVSFVPDTNNSASLGKLKFWDSTGAELADASTAIRNVTLRCRIRGN